jgi:putative transcriptional regulator
VWTRWIFAVAAVLLPATLLHAALPRGTNTSDRTWLNGHLLIALPQLHQQVFDHAVILVARHDREGAFGIVINRPRGKKPIARLLKALRADAKGIKDSVRVFSGGPVEPDVGLVVHTADYRRPETLDIDGRVALTAAQDVLRDIGLGKGPSKSLVVFGYAGWGPSQLDDELAHGMWAAVPEDPELVFDDDRTKVWADALARRKPVQ